MGYLKPVFLVKKFATTILIVAATFAAADVALAAEGPALPPAEYKPLPVGTKVNYDTWGYTVKRSDGFKTVIQTTKTNDWLIPYGVFVMGGKETLLASARGIVVTPKPQSIPSGFTVLSAASGQQISSGLDEAKHGLFSYYLMKGMEGGADANKDKKITAGELHAYLGKNVQKQAIRLGREQTPELSGDRERVLVRW